MKQLSLFEIQSEEYEQEIKQEQPIEENEFNVCPKCKVKPIVGKSKLHRTIDGNRVRTNIAQCPKCNYMVADLYNLVEHWNNCNRYRVRDGRL